jgi:(1->4)-alpha-D-glucan 1-alpha-D-glucosylmutase
MMPSRERARFVPASTYRLQIHSAFTLAAARAIVPYLQRLGIGAVYTSPYFAAEPGSTHGYDVTNHNLINPEAGGLEAHTAFTDAVKAAGLQHIVDFVPNHMGISTATNPWWRDVLANGPDAPSARFFDIDWDPFKAELRRKLLLPILGDQYGQVLDRGELQLELMDGQLVLKYFDHRPSRGRSIGCTTCSKRRPTGWPTGARRRMKSITAASSTSTRWRPCASRIRRSSSRFTGCWRLSCAKGV